MKIKGLLHQQGMPLFLHRLDHPFGEPEFIALSINETKMSRQYCRLIFPYKLTIYTGLQFNTKHRYL